MKGWRLHGQIIEEVMPDRYLEEDPGCETIEITNCIEVIDCTHLDTNAGFSRHNYWGLNNHMIEDICTLVGSRTPAKDRPHLVRRMGNVYDFLKAPAAVTA